MNTIMCFGERPYVGKLVVKQYKENSMFCLVMTTNFLMKDLCTNIESVYIVSKRKTPCRKLLYFNGASR